jgi:hypothetical protein
MDFGLSPFKKYIGMITAGYPAAYTNKSIYTAPEFILQNSPTVETPTEEGDVYSFGVML